MVDDGRTDRSWLDGYPNGSGELIKEPAQPKMLADDLKFILTIREQCGDFHSVCSLHSIE